MVATSLSWRCNSGTEALLEKPVFKSFPCCSLEASVAWQEDLEWFWRTPVLPAGPLGPGSLEPQDSVYHEDPFVLAEQPGREFGLAGSTLSDCLGLSQEKDWGNIRSNWTQGKPAHHTQGYTQGYSEKQDTVVLSVVFQALWWVHTCD